MKKTFVACLVLIAIALVPACKSRKTPAPVTAATGTDTGAPGVPPPPMQDTTPRVDPPTDCVQTDVQPREELPTDIEALNRFVQQKGYVRDAFFNYDESTLDDGAQAALSASA